MPLINRHSGLGVGWGLAHEPGLQSGSISHVLIPSHTNAFCGSEVFCQIDFCFSFGFGLWLRFGGWFGLWFWCGGFSSSSSLTSSKMLFIIGQVFGRVTSHSSPGVGVSSLGIRQAKQDVLHYTNHTSQQAQRYGVLFGHSASQAGHTPQPVGHVAAVPALWCPSPAFGEPSRTCSTARCAQHKATSTDTMGELKRLPAEAANRVATVES